MARRQLVGVVESNKMAETIVVEVTRMVKHPLYKRVVRQAKKFKVHNPHIKTEVGDEVRIEETRPISKQTRWRLIEVVRKGVGSKKSAVEELGNLSGSAVGIEQSS